MAPQYDINPDRKYSIAVVGGGIGGLCTAIGLLHQGVPVEIYEGEQRELHDPPTRQQELKR